MTLEVKGKKYFYVKPRYNPKIHLRRYTYKIYYYKTFENAFKAYKKEFRNYKVAFNRWEGIKMFVEEELEPIEYFENLRTSEVLYMFLMETYEDLITSYLNGKFKRNLFLIYKPILGFHDKSNLAYVFFGEVEYVKIHEVF